jgi:hemoglobin-like flavoprotein
MNETDKQLVRDSFVLLEQQSEIVPLIFFQRLFTTAPTLQPMFRGDMETQSQRFFTALRVIVASIDDNERLQKYLTPLAARHRHYGVRAWQYENFGEALLWTFSEVLGRQFTPSMMLAWREAYRLISRLMVETETTTRATA